MRVNEIIDSVKNVDIPVKEISDMTVTVAKNLYDPIMTAIGFGTILFMVITSIWLVASIVAEIRDSKKNKK